MHTCTHTHTCNSLSGHAEPVSPLCPAVNWWRSKPSQPPPMLVIGRLSADAVAAVSLLDGTRCPGFVRLCTPRLVHGIKLSPKAQMLVKTIIQQRFSLAMMTRHHPDHPDGLITRDAHLISCVLAGTPPCRHAFCCCVSSFLVLFAGTFCR